MSNSDVTKLKLDVLSSFSSSGNDCLGFERCGQVVFGGDSVVGESFIPLSNLACSAVFTRSVSRSNQTVFFVVFGMKPRNVPFYELFLNSASQAVEGFTQTLHPNV